MKIGRVIAGGIVPAVGVVTTEIPFIGFPLCALGGAIIGSGLDSDAGDKESEKPESPEPGGDSPTSGAPGAYGARFEEPLNVDAARKRRHRRAA